MTVISSTVCQRGEFNHNSERLVSKVVSCSHEARDVCPSCLRVELSHTSYLGYRGEFVSVIDGSSEYNSSNM